MLMGVGRGVLSGAGRGVLMGAGRGVLASGGRGVLLEDERGVMGPRAEVGSDCARGFVISATAGTNDGGGKRSWPSNIAVSPAGAAFSA